MNVLHILRYSIPNLSGYTIRSKYIVESEKQIGINPVVVTSSKYAHESPFVQRSTIEEINYYRTSDKNGFLKKLPYFGEMLQIKHLSERISDVVKKENISLIHAHSPSLNGLAGVRVSRQSGIPILYEMRALWEDAVVESGRMSKNSLKYKMSQYLERKLFDQVHAVIPISDHLKDKMISEGVPKDKIYVVPNGVDTYTFSPMPKDKRIMELYNLEGKTTFGYIGSFFKFEGVTYLVKAFSEIWRKNKDTRLILVGSGEDSNKIESLVRDLGLIDAVKIVGRVPHDQVLRYYSVVDIFVYPRIRVNLTEQVTPLKPLEAMSMEKAVIGSDVGGLKELIKDGETGLLFRAEDESDLVEKCMELINNTDKRSYLIKKAREYVVENKSWEKIAMRYLPIYDRFVKS